MRGTPYTGVPEVEPRFPQAEFQRIPTSPRMFGAQVGEAVQNVGRQAQRAADIFGQVAADDQVNHVLTGLDDLTTKFQSLHGKDALDQQDAIRQQMSDLVDSARGNLTSLEQETEFDRQVRFLHARADREIGMHADQQYQVWATGVNKASGDLALNGIGKATIAGDTDAVNNFTHDLITARTKQAQTVYGDDLAPEIRDSIVKDSTAEAAKSQIVALIGAGQAGRASSMLDANAQYFNPLEFESLKRSLKEPVIAEQAQQLFYGSPTPQPPTTMALNATRTALAAGGRAPSSINNPGNIRPIGAASGFNAYPDMDSGIAAIGQNLLAYQDQHGINTLAGVINRWAPPSENATGQLILNASSRTGYAPDQQIDLHDPAVRANVTQAIIQQEQGGLPAGVSPDRIQAAMSAEGGASTGPLTQQLQRIYASNADPLAKQAAAHMAVTYFDAQAADERRAYENQQHQIAMRSDAREKEIEADVFSNNPSITAKQIATDPALKPEAVKRMIDFVRAGPNPQVSAGVSHNTAMGLLEEMRLPAGNPARVNDMGPIQDAYGNNLLNRDDYDFLKGQLQDFRTPTGQRLADTQREFLAGMKASITKSNPLMGANDPDGDAQYYRFQYDVSQAVSNAREAGKDPFSLFNPGSPDYLGTPKALQSYRTSAASTLANKVSGLGGVATPAAAPTEPTLAPRNPGESLPDYVKRVGLLPGAGAAPAAPIAPAAVAPIAQP